MNDAKIVLFFLQTLHYRDDLEKSLFLNLTENTDGFQRLEDIYIQKVHPELLQNTVMVLKSFSILNIEESNYKIDKKRLSYFIKLVELAKAVREYEWPTYGPKPFLYISPPDLITAELSGDLNDITSLLIDLVRSANKQISIMSPFTNKEGFKSILTPLNACKNNPKITLYLTAKEQDREMIFKQIIDQVPQKMMGGLKIYFCSPELVKADNLPHAKVLIIDSLRGYLGSANFTRQGLESRFELGVELDKQQSYAVEQLFKLLVSREIFQEYKF
ncbi:MAG: phospholipase D-like domain-containing protein [Candidatus Daviesbacteria bacterium]|nr:phospholipase D-like domain-containing protein [Candidatus Daviesbacteria bacterium]